MLTSAHASAITNHDWHHQSWAKTGAQPYCIFFRNNTLKIMNIIFCWSNENDEYGIMPQVAVKYPPRHSGNSSPIFFRCGNIFIRNKYTNNSSPSSTSNIGWWWYTLQKRGQLWRRPNLKCIDCLFCVICVFFSELSSELHWQKFKATVAEQSHKPCWIVSWFLDKKNFFQEKKNICCARVMALMPCHG